MGKTQNERVLDYITKFGSINPMQALSDLGVMRLARRISDIKRMGINVRKDMVHAKNRYGEDVCFARYSLDSEIGGDLH